MDLHKKIKLPLVEKYRPKIFNDLLFDEMLKRETYIVPIYQYSIPVLIYMCYYHNNPCVFIISLESLETIYILPVIINIEFNNIFPIYNLSKSPPQTRYIPPYNPNIPSQNNYSVGMYTRFFCKRGNELSYIEISGQDFSKLNSKDPQIAWDLYSPASFIWRIKGNQEQVFNSNKGAAISLERNLRWPGFSQYFRDKFLQYYLES
jgi:hypothetical protein